MKNLLLLTVFISGNSFAQLANSSFEEWEGGFPKSWDLYDSFSEITGSFADTSDAVHGDKAIMIQNWYYYTVNGLSSTNFVTDNPSALNGFYKLITEDTEDEKRKALVDIVVYDVSNNIIAEVHERLDSVSTYTAFRVPIVYSNQLAQANKITLRFQNSDRYHCKAPNCNSLFLDGLELDYTVTSVPENENKNVSFFPNPVENVLNVKGGGSDLNRVFVYNVNGSLIASFDGVSSSIDFSTFSAGVYFVKILSAKNKVAHFERVIKK